MKTLSPRPRLLFAAASMVLLAALPARAQNTPAAPIQALNQALVSVMKAGQSTPFTKRYAMLAPVVEQAFDLHLILRNAVGLRWSQIPADQKGQLQDEFDKFTVASYLANFDSYNGQRFEIVPGERSVGTEKVVQTEIVPTSGDKNRIDYVMRDEGGSWKAVDVLLDGSISRVAVTRSDFRSLLRSGNATALIAKLKNKVSDLSDGTMQ